MNNTFNLTRFGWYFKKHTIDHGRTYLLSLVAAVGIVFLGLGLPAFLGVGVVTQNYQYGMYIFLIWLGGSIFTSTIFAELSDRKKAILTLTLPVSHLERFLVAWLYTFPIFLVAANICFFAVDSLVLSMSHPVIEPNRLLNLFDTKTPGILALVAFMVFQIPCFWGAVYFNKLHFIKTAFLFFMACLAITILNKAILRLVSGGDLSSYNLFFQNQVFIKGKYYSFTLSNSTYIISWIIYASTGLLLLVSAFYKLKEKQV
ncbi:hypothetical protein [Mucilaginibacter panaciglaebae]|uniref:ABC-2 type transport system permease protein n=1 Tax=Mucilaginibacter panaciglaebae TaxID=502331 RepID=A0ABP7WWN1_9SPHI